MANSFVGFNHRTFFDNISKTYCYTRYVDETFTSFSSRREFFFPYLNTLHTSLKFAMEVEENNEASLGFPG